MVSKKSEKAIGRKINSCLKKARVDSAVKYWGGLICSPHNVVFLSIDDKKMTARGRRRLAGIMPEMSKRARICARAAGETQYEGIALHEYDADRY